MDNSNKDRKEEIRRAFDHELERRVNAESKASTLFGFGAIVSSIQAFTLSFLVSNGRISSSIGLAVVIFGLLGILIIIVSLFYLLKVINVRIFFNPYQKRLNEIHNVEYTEKYFSSNYRRSIYQNCCVNNRIINSLRMGRFLIFSGVIISIIPIFLIAFKAISISVLVAKTIPLIVLGTILFYLLSLFYLKYSNESAQSKIRIAREWKLNYNTVYKEECLDTYTGHCDENYEHKFKTGDIVFFCPICKKWLCTNCQIFSKHKHSEVLADFIIDDDDKPKPIKSPWV